MFQPSNSPITEQRNPKTSNLDKLSVLEIIRIMNEEDRKVSDAVSQALPEISVAIDAIVQVINKGGRLFYIGAGTSGRLGILDASECSPTFGVPESLVTGLIAGGDVAIKTSLENVEDDQQAGEKDIARVVTHKDAVVGLAASGRTPYVLGAIQEANRQEAVTVGISCNLNTPLSEHACYSIEIPVGPEVITGSTRMKAGTAQKMVLNMITSTTMVKLGKVYGNLMVNVQASNEKLRNRVVRIVTEATSVSESEAMRYSELAKGDARVAILMIKCSVSNETAQQALKQSGEHFGKALKILSLPHSRISGEGC